MVAKRALFPAQTQLAKRVKKVERHVRNQRPEMKHISWGANTTVAAGALNTINLTQLAQGVTINQRMGDRVRVWRVEVRGIAHSRLDHYLTQLHTTTVPDAAKYGPYAGAFLLDSEANTRFTVWKHYRSLYNAAPFAPLKFVQKFKNGIIVKYNTPASTGCVDNGLVLQSLNRSAIDCDLNYSVRMWYTDA